MLVGSQGRLLGIKSAFTTEVARVAVSLSGPCDPQVAANADYIYQVWRSRPMSGNPASYCEQTWKLTTCLQVLQQEELAFSATLERGQKQLNEMLAALARTATTGSAPSMLSGQDAFLLYDSFGFPLELTQEIAGLQNVLVG